MNFAPTITNGSIPRLCKNMNGLSVENNHLHNQVLFYLSCEHRREFPKKIRQMGSRVLGKTVKRLIHPNKS